MNTIQKMFERAIIKSKLTKPNVHFHTLRHSAITFWLDKGVDLHTIQQWAGHSRLDTTGMYLHMSPEKSRKEMEKIWE